MTDHNGWDTAEERRIAEALAAAGLVDHDHFFVERESCAAADVRFFVAVIVGLLREEREPTVEQVKADALREAANAYADDAGSSDYLAAEVSDAGLLWTTRWLRDRATRIAESEGRP